MRIGELAAAVSVDASTLRFYESEGLVPEPARTSGGYRDYTPVDLDRLRFIVAARALDLGLDDIREILALRDDAEPPCGYVRRLLDDHAASIRRRIDELTALEAELEALRRRARQIPDSTDEQLCVCHIIETGA